MELPQALCPAAADPGIEHSLDVSLTHFNSAPSGRGYGQSSNGLCQRRPAATGSSLLLSEGEVWVG